MLPLLYSLSAGEDTADPSPYDGNERYPREGDETVGRGDEEYTYIYI